MFTFCAFSDLMAAGKLFDFFEYSRVSCDHYPEYSVNFPIESCYHVSCDLSVSLLLGGLSKPGAILCWYMFMFCMGTVFSIKENTHFT
jgi:hypothetical protein